MHFKIPREFALKHSIFKTAMKEIAHKKTQMGIRWKQYYYNNNNFLNEIKNIKQLTTTAIKESMKQQKYQILKSIIIV